MKLDPERDGDRPAKVAYVRRTFWRLYRKGIAMLNETLDSPGGEIAVKKKAKKPSRADRIAAWRKENRAAYTVAYRACCTCAPTRAQALLVDQFLGNVPVPID